MLRPKTLFLLLPASIGTALAVFFYCASASPGRGTGNSPLAMTRTAEDLLTTSNFVLTYQIGGGPEGYYTLQISSSGHAAILEEPQFLPSARHASLPRFQVSGESIEHLRKLILQNGLLKLNREYHADVCDGVQTSTMIAIGKAVYVIECNNYFPNGILALDAELRQRVLPQEIRFPPLVD